jgi:hypothetical protein
METILATVTVISLALAAGMGVLLARLLREERRRSDARVALLTELAARQEHVQHVAPQDLRFRELDAPAPVTAGNLFAGEHTRSAWPFRLAAAAVVIVAVAAVTWGAQRLSTTERTATEEPVTTGMAAQPLELLSLEHRRDADDLTISGIVQNPREGTALSRIEATVLALDRDGKQVASARAPIDFTTLAPGQESPFFVRVPAANVARFRVSFTGPGNQPLTHVDRRNLDSLARKEVP